MHAFIRFVAQSIDWNERIEHWNIERAAERKEMSDSATICSQLGLLGLSLSICMGSYARKGLQRAIRKTERLQQCAMFGWSFARGKEPVQEKKWEHTPTQNKNNRLKWSQGFVCILLAPFLAQIFFHVTSSYISLLKCALQCSMRAGVHTETHMYDISTIIERIQCVKPTWANVREQHTFHNRSIDIFICCFDARAPLTLICMAAKAAGEGDSMHSKAHSPASHPFWIRQKPPSPPPPLPSSSSSFHLICFSVLFNVSTFHIHVVLHILIIYLNACAFGIWKRKIIVYPAQFRIGASHTAVCCIFFFAI